MITAEMWSAAQVVIGRRWREDQPPEQERILSLARDALVFVSETGQQHKFEDFRAFNHIGVPQESASPFEELMRETETFFMSLLVDAEGGSSGEQKPIQLIIDTIRFIVLSRQCDVFQQYLRYLEADAPPLIVASFATLGEAEAWLKNQPKPPDFASILVAGTYYYVVYDQERNRRWLAVTRTLQHHLSELELMNEPAIAEFASREQADAWLRAQPAPVMLAKVLIGGMPYAAVYYFNIDQRVFCPLAPARRG